MMTKVESGGGRLYDVVKTMVFVVTLLAGSSSVYYGYILGTRTIENEWKGYCVQYQDPAEHANCMMLSFKLIGEFKNILKLNLAIATLLPVFFLGGKCLYRCLYAQKKELRQ